MLCGFRRIAPEPEWGHNGAMTTTHKINFRLPMDLLEEAKAQATALGVSLNAYLLFAVHEQVRKTRRELGGEPSAPRKASRAAAKPVLQQGERVGRNDPCPCGSGRKAKHCHPDRC